MSGGARRAIALLATIGAACAPATVPQSAPTASPLTSIRAIDSIAKLPGAQMEGDTISQLTPARLATLDPARRAAWNAYLTRSLELSARDHAAMAAELRALQRDTMVRAPWTHAFEVTSAMTPAWFAGDSARRIGESILSYQTPSGGWSKHVDFGAGLRAPGQSWFSETNSWRYIATIDNSSTTEEMRFLALLDRARPDARYRDAYARGVRYLLDAQMPNGCWPQVFPLQGGYHDAATFNDDAIVHVAQLLREVAGGQPGFVADTLRRAAGRAEQRAVECMLDAQVVLNGRLTVWGQQHDPLTLSPTSARSYELASLTGYESAGIAQYLMSIEMPSARVVRAVHSAADWFRANRIDSLTYRGYSLERHPGPTPLWGRMIDLETGRSIFSNRDGVKLYDYERLTDRRTGYRWFTPAPTDFLREYDRWAVAHPR